MKIFKIIFCVLFIVLTLSGCNESQRISDLTIVQAFGIDSENNKTKIHLQFLNLSNNSGSTEELTGNITDVSSGEGETISDAVSSASKSLSNEIFFGQNKIIVFGNEYAQRNMDKGIDYLLRSIDSRPDVIVALSESKAEDIIKNKERGSRIPAENIYNLLKLGEENGNGGIVSVADLLNLYNDETSDIYIPVLKSETDSVSCSGIAVFSNEKHSATLDEEKTFGFLFVQDKIDSGVITVDTQALDKIALEISSSKTRKSVKTEKGKIIFEIHVKLRLIINEIENGISRSLAENDLTEIEMQVEKKIKKLCEDSVKACYMAESDPFMTARYLYFKDSALYEKLKPDWRKTLSGIEVRVDVASTIQRVNDNSNQ